ncbi:MAG: hypothetical protein E6Q76_07500 [Rhizobium sp.]|nr:MAG: hypothetical protein E6Q76_07500 [Rhizobium sp.]
MPVKYALILVGLMYCIAGYMEKQDQSMEAKYRASVVCHTEAVDAAVEGREAPACGHQVAVSGR